MPSEARAGRRPWPRTCAALAAWLVLVLAPGRGTAEPIERILAVVDGRPLMLSDVRLLERLRGLAPAAALEILIDEALMFREASRLPASLATAGDAEHAYASLLERLGEPAGALEDGLKRLARRESAILKYVAFRFGPQVRVDDATLRAAYEARQAQQPEAPPFEDVAAELRQRLERDELDLKVDAWVRELREGAGIVYIPEPAPTAARPQG
jgi:hypothetical protein